MSLLDEYPGYSSFVEPALRGTDYARVSCRTWQLRNATPLFFVHSPQDELLSYVQTCEALKLAAQTDGRGHHLVSIPRSRPGACAAKCGDAQVADLYSPVAVPDWVHVDMESVQGTHDGMLQRTAFWDMLLRITKLHRDPVCPTST